MALADMSLLVGTWELTKAATITAPIHESLAESTEESVLSPDFRSMVDEADYKDGGKYRCEYSPLVSATEYCYILSCDPKKD